MDPADKTNKRSLPDDWDNYNNNDDSSKKSKNNHITDLAKSTISSDNPTPEIKFVNDIEIELPAIWHRASEGDWKKVEELLPTVSKEDLLACPLTGEYAGKGVLWFLAFKYYDSDWNDLNESPLFNDILELNPDAVIDKNNPLALSRVLRYTLRATNGDFNCSYIQKWLNLSPKNDFYGTELHVRIICVLLFQAGLNVIYSTNNNWTPVNQIIESHPWLVDSKYIKTALEDEDLFPGASDGGDYTSTMVFLAVEAFWNQQDCTKNLIGLLAKTYLWCYWDLNEDEFEDKSIFIDEIITLLVFVNHTVFVNHAFVNHHYTDEYWDNRALSIFNTMDSIITSWDWQNPNVDEPQYLCLELRYKIAIETLIQSFPVLKYLPKSVLVEKLEERANILDKNHLDKAIDWTKKQAFGEYRQRKRLQKHNYRKSQVTDFQDTIASSMLDYKKTHPLAKYTKEKRECLVKKIGKNEQILIKHPSFYKDYIKKTIKNVMERDEISMDVEPPSDVEPLGIAWK